MAEITSITEEEPLISSEFNQLEEEVVANFNSQPSSNSQTEKPLPEAEFNIPKSNSNGGGNFNSEDNKQSAFNQDFADLPQDEQEEGAEQTAELVIIGYSQLKMLLPKALSVSEKQLNKKERDGELNLSIPFKRSPNDHRPTTVGQLVQQFNESIKKPFETSELFINGVRPLLVSIFKKKGVALSPEHLLMILVAQDVIGTGITAAQCLAERKEMFNDLKELTETYKKQNIATSPIQPIVTPPPSQSYTPSSPNRREPDEPNVQFNDDNIGDILSEKQKGKKTSIVDVSNKVIATEERKQQNKKERKVRKARTPKVVVKATNSGATQN